MENRKEYMKEYNREYYRSSGAPNSKIEGKYIKAINKPIPPNENNFNGNDEPFVCKKFGCKKHLSITERLFGNMCQEHSIPDEKINASNHIVHFKKAI